MVGLGHYHTVKELHVLAIVSQYSPIFLLFGDSRSVSYISQFAESLTPAYST